MRPRVTDMGALLVLLVAAIPANAGGQVRQPDRVPAAVRHAGQERPRADKAPAAQERRFIRPPANPSAQYGQETRLKAYDNGYSEGFKAGERDAKDRRFGFEDEADYKTGDKGYEARSGDRGLYVEFFRQGFAAGYSRGFSEASSPRDRRPFFERFRQRDMAYENGYADGFERGVGDAEKRQTYEPLRHGSYRAADRGFTNWYGPRQQYENAYRSGFLTGYEAGYKGWQKRDVSPQPSGSRRTPAR